jgi:hypothetical protein
MFPENLLRFDMEIRINDVRNFVIPKKDITNTYTSNEISKKSKIIYTLHDCNFDFFDSRNYGDNIEIGGFSSNSYTPQSLSFNIHFKSVTRWSEFPLQNPLQSDSNFYTPGSIDGWEKNLSHGNTVDSKYFKNIEKTKNETVTYKGYANDLLGKAAQTVANQSLNYMDNLEAKLREVRGGVVNDALKQLNNFTNINKIEPDNVYSRDFNNKVSLSNFGKQIASGLLTDLTDTVRDATNF